MDGHWLVPGAIYRATNVLSAHEHRALLDYAICKPAPRRQRRAYQTPADEYWHELISKKIRTICLGQIQIQTSPL
jgi:hypothetical protein